MLSVKKKCVPLQSQSGNKTVADIKLGYGVMVTLQILVLSFLVRVRVSQQEDASLYKGLHLFCFIVLIFFAAMISGGCACFSFRYIRTVC